jgi:prepilin-type N-terminal cleavage/methylation domain-containing protein
MIKNKGFTLIELLMVISIIGLLSSIVFSSLQDSRDKANNTKKNQLVAQYVRAAELYKDKYGEYPDPGNQNFDWCLGPYLATDKCYQGLIAFNFTLSSSFDEFLSGPPADNTIIVPSNTYGYKGILYQCSSRINNECQKYRFAWLLIGNKNECTGGADVSYLGTNKLCKLYSY